MAGQGGGASRAFILLALRHRHLDPASLQVAAAAADWQAMRAAAADLGLAPLLFRAVVEAGVERQVPAGVLEWLALLAGQTAASNMLLVREAGRIQQALRGRGIESLLLKGLGLLAQAPDYGPLRHVGDVDLLVSPDRLDEALAVLVAAGARVTEGPPDALGGGLTAATRSGGYGHCLVAVRTRAGVLVELHHDLPSFGPTSAGTLEELLRSGMEVPCGDVSLRVPTLEDLMGMLCWHVVNHNRLRATLLPRHLADVEELLELGVDLRAATERYGEAVSRSVRLLERVAGQAARPSRLGAGVLERPFSRRWRRVDTRLEFLRALRWGGLAVVLPPRAMVARQYGVPADVWWVPALYLYRPLRAAFRLLRGR